MLEASVKKACLGWLKSLPNSHWWSNPVSKFGVAGRPDIEGVWNGSYVGIECKTPDAYKKKLHGLSPAQSKWMIDILQSNGAYYVIDSLDRLKGTFTRSPRAPGYTSPEDHPCPDEHIAE